MKTLELEFNKNGFHYSQVFRNGMIAIYKQTGFGGEWYEVIIIQENKEREINGVKIAAGESMPGNESWGQKGWTYDNLTDALSKAGTLHKLAEDRILDHRNNNQL
jgi:hypothetical protein